MPRLRGAYLPHPAHLAFIRQHLEPSLEKVCVVDLPNEPQSEVTLAQARACIIGFLASPAGSPERKPR